MGWLTLHSISVAYPESPTSADREILNVFMSKFAECITCPSCKSHFTGMFAKYRQIHPEWANSRYDLFLAVCRMHNTVNRRLDKPLQKTVSECLTALKLATRDTPCPAFRQRYINHVIRNWAAFQSGEGMIMVSAAKEMGKINDQYWNPRNVEFGSLEFPEANVLEFVPEDRERLRVGPNIPTVAHLTSGELPKVGFKIQGGRLRLGGR